MKSWMSAEEHLGAKERRKKKRGTLALSLTPVMIQQRRE
jgi:hypothetical protein